MERNDNQKSSSSNIPENNSSKAMDSKKDVEQSNDEKTDQDFPGYPHYPAKEDIMNQKTGNHRVDMDVENLPRNNNTTGIDQRFPAEDDKKKTEGVTTSQPGQNDDDLDIKMGTEADIPPDELAMLQEDLSMPNRDDDNLRAAKLDNTDFEGEELNEESFGEVETGVDLDVPDSVDETTTTSLGQGDEENKYYSLGGDRQEKNEDDPSETW